MRSLWTVFGLLFGLMLSWARGVTAQDLKVLVLDALDGNPGENVEVESLCAGPPRNAWGKTAFTNGRVIATIFYSCNEKRTIEIEVFPPNKKEQCGADANTGFNDGMSASDPSSAGGICCTNKVSKKLKPVPGQVIIFVKKATWWQSHVAGE